MAPSVGPPQPGGNGLGMLTFTGDETVSGAAPAVGAAHNATTASAAAAKRVLRISSSFVRSVDDRPSPTLRDGLGGQAIPGRASLRTSSPAKRPPRNPADSCSSSLPATNAEREVIDATRSDQPGDSAC